MISVDFGDFGESCYPILFSSTGVAKYRIGREEDKHDKVRLMGARLNKGIFNMDNTEQVK